MQENPVEEPKTNDEETQVETDEATSTPSEEKPSETMPQDKYDQILDATRELTSVVSDLAKEVGELKEEWQKWRKAGKF